MNLQQLELSLTVINQTFDNFDMNCCYTADENTVKFTWTYGDGFKEIETVYTWIGTHFNYHECMAKVNGNVVVQLQGELWQTRVREQALREKLSA